MPRKERIATLDVGTSKICALVGEIEENGTLDVLGVGLSPSVGIRKGVVIDIERNAQAIRLALKRAEQMAGMGIDEVWVGVAGAHIASQNSHGMVAVTGEKKEIKESDIKRVIEASQIISLPPSREILHVLPREFVVDGNSGIKDPEGMSGVRLEVHSHIVTASATSLENLIKGVERSGLFARGIILDLLAVSDAVLTPDEKDLGVVLVDMGGGTTDIAIFKDGGLVFTKILPVGGSHVTNDIAVGLRTAVKNAEQIKVLHGQARNDNDSDETITVLTTSGKDEREVPKRMLLEIIEPRMVEIFQLIKTAIEESGYAGLTPAGVVFTGGGSLLKGAMEAAGETLDIPVRLGYPEEVKGLNELGEGASGEAGLGYVLAPPVFSTAIGLMYYGMGSKPDKRAPIKDSFWGYLKKIGDKLKDTF